jgi:hypothetical protein
MLKQDLVHNKPLSDDLASDEKFRNYNSWLKEHGALTSKLQYPAVFTPPGGGFALNGVLCTEEIKNNEVICYIPNKMLISTTTARNSEIAEIYRCNSELFVEHPDRDFYTILMFLLYEKAKGEDSFWHEYFETC